jgi:hypothetical protein
MRLCQLPGLFGEQGRNTCILVSSIHVRSGEAILADQVQVGRQTTIDLVDSAALEEGQYASSLRHLYSNANCDAQQSIEESCKTPQLPEDIAAMFNTRHQRQKDHEEQEQQKQSHSKQDQSREKAAQTWLSSLQFVIVHNSMDVASMDLVRRCECAIVTTSSITKSGMAASCTGCV